MSPDEFQHLVVTKLDKIDTRLAPVEKHVLVVNTIFKVFIGIGVTAAGLTAFIVNFTKLMGK
jgi:uncharacterized membrane protein